MAVAQWTNGQPSLEKTPHLAPRAQGVSRKRKEWRVLRCLRLQEALTSREQHGEAEAAPAPAPGGPRQRASRRGPCCHLRRTVSLASTAHPWSPQYHLCLSRLLGVSRSGEGRGREKEARVGTDVNRGSECLRSWPWFSICIINKEKHGNIGGFFK